MMDFSEVMDFVTEIGETIADWDAPDLGWEPILPHLSDGAAAILQKAIDLQIPYEEVARNLAAYFDSDQLAEQFGLAGDFLTEVSEIAANGFMFSARTSMSLIGRASGNPIVVGVAAVAAVGGLSYAGYRYFSKRKRPKLLLEKERDQSSVGTILVAHG